MKNSEVFSSCTCYQAVTRTGVAQALIIASEKVPGVGVSEITQTLVRTSERGVLMIDD